MQCKKDRHKDIYRKQAHLKVRKPITQTYVYNHLEFQLIIY